MQRWPDENFASAWREASLGFDHRGQDWADPPTAAACIWWRLAIRYPDELKEFLHAWGVL